MNTFYWKAIIFKSICVIKNYINDWQQLGDFFHKLKNTNFIIIFSARTVVFVWSFHFFKYTIFEFKNNSLTQFILLLFCFYVRCSFHFQNLSRVFHNIFHLLRFEKFLFICVRFFVRNLRSEIAKQISFRT